jgi:hypothetical protein
MPISQKTILSIYGDLCTLVEGLEALREAANEPDMFIAAEGRLTALLAALEALAASGHRLQQSAIEEIVGEAPEYEVNPITGRISE